MASPLQRSDVLDALRPIIDPDFGKSIVDLGFVKNLMIEGGKVRFTIELTTPACPVKEQFEQAARERVAGLAGVDSVEVEMTADTRGRRAQPKAADASQPPVLPGVRNVLAVASGKGGVGKSTVAVNIALALRESGASIETTMALTGHRSLDTVLKHYREVPQSDIEEAVAAIDRSRAQRGGRKRRRR